MKAPLPLINWLFWSLIFIFVLSAWKRAFFLSFKHNASLKNDRVWKLVAFISLLSFDRHGPIFRLWSHAQKDQEQRNHAAD